MADPDLTTGIPDSELRDGEKLAGRVGDERVLLVRCGEEVHAVGATCPHYGADLAEGAVVDGTIRCPWHHACFDLRTGSVLRAPALVPLSLWRVDRRGGRLFVTRRLHPAPPPKTEGPDSVVIVGAGAAGVNVADTLRREGYDGRIVLISREAELPYDKPNLSKGFLAGAAPAEWLPLHPLEHDAALRIEPRLGVTVSAVDTAARLITTSSGERVSYGALVLATGASPRRLSIAGGEDVAYLRTRRDAERIVQAARAARNAAVIGSGFLGLEVAASLRQKGLDVVVVSPERIPLERPLGPALGARIRRIHEEHGVVFRLGRFAVAVETGDVLLDDGSRVAADLVVAGIGVSPCVELARAAGLAVEDGVVVDEYLETSEPRVFACGDIASWPDAWTGERLRVEHWVVAGRQGQTVARNILGRRERFRAVPFFWSAHFDVVIAHVGYGSGWDTGDVDGSLERNDATVVYRRAGRVWAVATVGRDAVSLAAEAAMERGDRAGLEEVLDGKATASLQERSSR
jgi:NADPH-dependent 2,4-dienoyl-CoA reductase/sulfur reductase-like enzyme/nitrite reductase/ring-hydroxylating ferredoxin subunit